MSQGSALHVAEDVVVACEAETGSGQVTVWEGSRWGWGKWSLGRPPCWSPENIAPVVRTLHQWCNLAMLCRAGCHRTSQEKLFLLFWGPLKRQHDRQVCFSWILGQPQKVRRLGKQAARVRTRGNNGGANEGGSNKTAKQILCESLPIAGEAAAGGGAGPGGRDDGCDAHRQQRSRALSSALGCQAGGGHAPGCVADGQVISCEQYPCCS